MKSLVLFAAALLCLQAVRVPHVTADSSEEEYHILLPPSDKGLLSFIGISNPPVIKAIKVKVPYYADPALKQQIIEKYLTLRGLTPHVLAAGQNAAPATNEGADDLNSRLESFYNLGLSRQPTATTPPPDVVIKSVAEPSTNITDEPLVTYDTVPARKRRQVLELSTASPMESTTVPDVSETSTMTELWAEEGITVMLDLSLPVSSTDSPISTTTSSAVPPTASPTATVTTSKPEPFIPLFGFGAILPASVSRVPFAPRIPIDTSANSATTEGPVIATVQASSTVTPLFPAHSRRARAVPFNAKNQMQLTKVTPVPPLPQTDVRAPKMSDLQSSRKLRAVPKEAVAAPHADVKQEVGSTIAELEVTTESNNCDIECTKFEFNPVCAFNGDCYHQFANQCVMDVFVCKRPELGFKATPRQRCAMHWLKRCRAEELESK